MFILLIIIEYIIKSDLYKKYPDSYVGGTLSSKTDKKLQKNNSERH